MNKVLDIVSKLCCFVLSIILFILVFLYLIFSAGNKIIVKENIVPLISSLKIEEILSDDYIEEIYEYTDQKEIDRDLIYQTINENNFKECLAKYYSNYIEKLLYNKENKNITKDELMNVLESNLEKKSNDLNEEEKEIIILALDNKLDEVVKELSTDSIDNNFTEKELSTVRFTFGNGLKNVLLIIIIIVVVLIALFRWSLYRFAIWTGVTSTIAGIIFIALGQSLSSIIGTSIANDVSLTNLSILQTNIVNVMTKLGTTTLIIGIIQIIYYVIFSKSNKNVKV